MSGAEADQDVAPKEGDGGFGKLAASLAPVILAAFTFIFLLLMKDSGVRVFDVNTWPASAVHDCGKVEPTKCASLESYYAHLRIVTMCAALLPLLSAFGYIPAVTKVVRAGRSGSGWVDILLYLAGLGVFVNAIWIFNIYLGYSQLSGSLAITSGDIFIVSMFAIFLIIDLCLMRVHDAAAGGQREVEFDFFFGNAFFIDIPTLSGVVCIIVFTSLIVSTLGSVPVEVTEAVAGAAVVLHVVVSQVVFAFLLLQMKLKRGSSKVPTVARPETETKKT